MPLEVLLMFITWYCCLLYNAFEALASIMQISCSISFSRSLHSHQSVQFKVEDAKRLDDFRMNMTTYNWSELITFVEQSPHKLDKFFDELFDSKLRFQQCVEPNLLCKLQTLQNHLWLSKFFIIHSSAKNTFDVVDAITLTVSHEIELNQRFVCLSRLR